MRVLVIDVAAEHGGAVTILEQFIREFESDSKNEYIVAVSVLQYPQKENIHFVSYPWVKKSKLHRLFFDTFYIHKIIREVKPDRVLSLQNKGVVTLLPQDVYFHNALFICEKKFCYSEDKTLWLYQNVLSFLTKNSLNHAESIIVQAEWIKDALSKKWNIPAEKLVVKKPIVDEQWVPNIDTIRIKGHFFYPANASVYKNHIVLLKTAKLIWDRYGSSIGLKLFLTGQIEDLSQECQDIIQSGNYPIAFLGRLNKEEMKHMYEKTNLVFPSFVETVGLPLIEAQKMGCHIICADCEYAHEAIGQYNNVSYFEPQDENSLYSVLEAYLLSK